MIVSGLLAGANCIISAQQPESNLSDSLNADLKKIAKPESIRGWIKFKEDAHINPATVFIEHKVAFDLADNDNMVMLKTETDDLGFTHHQYQQYYKTLPIDGATFTVHSNRNGFPYAGNGKLVTGIDINTAPQLGTEQAIEFALLYMDAKEYMWQSGYWEKDLKSRTGKSDTSFYPGPELVIKQIVTRKPGGAFEKYSFLAYRLDIYCSSPFISKRIFIDANNGKILEAFPLQSN